MDRAVSHLLPGKPRSDPEIVAECDLILEAAADWQAGILSLSEFMRLGAITDWNGRPNPKYTRWVAMCTASLLDPRRRALAAILDTVTKAQAIVTDQGVFTQDELNESNQHLIRAGLHRDPWENAA